MNAIPRFRFSLLVYDESSEIEDESLMLDSINSNLHQLQLKMKIQSKVFNKEDGTTTMSHTMQTLMPSISFLRQPPQQNVALVSCRYHKCSRNLCITKIRNNLTSINNRSILAPTYTPAHPFVVERPR
ncbi:hypothetical protein OROMI_020999 [Orobanche minor]